jgi:hypothetical protein
MTLYKLSKRLLDYLPWVEGCARS